MRNFKKILSLVLCMAMMLSVMVVGAGAAFSDQSKIKNTEAVDMCSALNIINGYTDGSFKPEGTITRAEACKMICIALNGGKDPVLGTNATPTFTDIKGHWAEKYIEYCVSLGIVAGVGGGKFDPAGNVTGSQFAKMLLIAMGYSADTEKFTGSAWEVNVNVRASQKALYEDLESMDPSVALTRDNAAQMVWNALNANMVEYDYKLSTVNGTLTSEMVVKDIKNQTLLSENYGTIDTDLTTGILTGIFYNTTKEEYTYTIQTMDAQGVLVNMTNGTFVAEEDYTDLLGHNVTFVAKAKDDVYGAYANDSFVLVSGVIDDIDIADYSKDKTVEVDGTDYDVDAAAFGVTYGTDKHATTINWTSRMSMDEVANADAYFDFSAIDWDDDDDIDLFVIYPAIMKEVTYVHSDYIKVAEVGKTGGVELTTKEAYDWVVYDGIAKEDIVRIEDDMTLKTLGSVTKMEAVKGEVSAITTSKDTAVIDGTTYNYSLAASDDDMKNYLDETIEFYVINGFMFEIDADVAADLSDFVILADIAASAGLGGYYEAEVTFTDGTTEVVKVKAAEDSTLAEDTLYTYEIKDGKYELTNATLTTADFDVVGNKGETMAWAAADKDADTVAKVDGYKFADDAVVLVKTEDDGYVLKSGSDMAKVTESAATIYYYGADKNDKTNVISIAFAVIETEGASVSEWQYGYVTSEVQTKTSSDGDYSILTVWTGTESVELTTDAGVIADTDKGSVVKFKVNEENLVSQIADLSKVENAAVAGAVTKIDGDEIDVKYAAMPAAVTFTVDEDDTVVIYVDKSENVGMPADKIVLADKDEDEKEINNVYIYDAEFDKTLEVIVIDIDNEWK